MTILCRLGLHAWDYWLDHLERCAECGKTRPWNPPRNQNGQPLR